MSWDELMNAPRYYSPLWLLPLLYCLLIVGLAHSAEEEVLPEQEEIDAIILGETPEGVLFTVMEQDEEALQWVLPRILHYTRQLRGEWQGLHIAVVSHGEEMLGLLTEFRSLYPDVHDNLQRLVGHYGAAFHVCGSFATLSDVEASEFPGYVDVVPFGPAQIADYRQLGYRVVSIELTW